MADKNIPLSELILLGCRKTRQCSENYFLTETEGELVMAQIEELLGRSVEDLMKMSYADIENELKHYFVITRPDPNKKILREKLSHSSSNSKIERAKAIAKSMNIDLGFED